MAIYHGTSHKCNIWLVQGAQSLQIASSVLSVDTWARTAQKTLMASIQRYHFYHELLEFLCNILQYLYITLLTLSNFWLPMYKLAFLSLISSIQLDVRHNLERKVLDWHFSFNFLQGGCCKICSGVTHLARDCPNKGIRSTGFGKICEYFDSALVLWWNLLRYMFLIYMWKNVYSILLNSASLEIPK